MYTKRMPILVALLVLAGCGGAAKQDRAKNCIRVLQAVPLQNNIFGNAETNTCFVATASIGVHVDSTPELAAFHSGHLRRDGSPGPNVDFNWKAVEAHIQKLAASAEGIECVEAGTLDFIKQYEGSLENPNQTQREQIEQWRKEILGSLGESKYSQMTKVAEEKWNKYEEGKARQAAEATKKAAEEAKKSSDEYARTHTRTAEERQTSEADTRARIKRELEQAKKE